MDDQNASVKLCYTIHKYSSYSANYIPENIMVNNPSDQLSRWFTDASTPSQYIILKLKSPSIVETIKFGKFIKAHVSDLKKFQVYGGTDEVNMSLLLSAGLKKDNSPETFRLRHRTQEGLHMPISYLKIVPLQSWGPAYNYSIWYVELLGKNLEELINPSLDTLCLRKEEEAVRIILKHLRQRRYKDAYEALSRETGVRLEGPVQARLWNALVENGDFKLAEEIFEGAVADGEVDWYMSWQALTPVWEETSACSEIVQERLWRADIAPITDQGSNSPDSEDMCGGVSCCNKPGPRGGHQLVVDSATGTLYLFGGWNGSEDLDDLWSYCTTSKRWSLLCMHSGLQAGPGPRSCHKMVFDPVHKRLFTLGRYLNNAQRIPSNMNSDMYMYDLATSEWSLLCSDTATIGGPRLVFDHQMCIDPDTQTIYVFGGRILPSNTEEVSTQQYSGMFAYYISRGTWEQLPPPSPAPAPRVSHSMLFHPTQRRLYIFGGQRNKQHLLELWWWDVGAQQCALVCGSPGGAGGGAPPAAGFTQRATLDPDSDLMFVLSGISKEKDKRVYNALWVFSLRRLTWTCVYRNENVTPDEPRPRFAHQLIYDPVRKIHYLSGGNPGNESRPRLRLDDLWSLTLTQPSIDSIVNECRLALRIACYEELTKEPAVALEYLRTRLREALDENDPEQLSRFHLLPVSLFERAAAGRGGAYCALSGARARALCRRRAAAPPAAQADHAAHALAAVLGADDSIPTPPLPFEDVSPPSPDSWDVGEDLDSTSSCPCWDQRATRIELYHKLCRYFQPSRVHPQVDVMDLVTL